MLVLAQKVKRVKHGDCIVPVIPSSHPQGKVKGKGEAMASTASATAVLARRGLCSSSPCARVAISSGSLQKFVGQKSTTSGGSNCRRCHLGSSFVSRSWRAVVSSGTSQSGDFAALSESIALLRRFYGVQAARQRPVVTASSASPVGTIVTESSSGVEASTAGDAVEPLSWRASIDFKGIRENKDAIAANIINRKSSGDVELVVRLYEQSVQLSMEVDKLRAERNAVASAMKGKLEQAKRQELINQGKELKDRLAGLEVSLGQLSDRLQREGQRIPNMTHPSVPIGSEDVATVRKLVGEKPDFLFPVKSHVELGQELDLFDFESAAEVSGNKFYYLKNEAVLLEMALINWTLSELIKRGFTPLTTPDLVRSSVVEKCGFQPRGQNTQVYSVEDTDLCLAGTAEIPVGGMYMDSMLTEAALPLRIVAFSHCFRTEAGAAGSATRGLYRVHQFSKLEMFAICKPEESEALHEELISIEEELYTSLGLHFKTLDMSSEDLGAPAHRKYDVEAWMPGLDRYGEVSSASNCTDYQSRRLNIRYRPEHNMMRDGPKTKLPPPVFAHTLNATACAVPRMIIAILENFQQVDGSVVVPEPLRPFMGGIEVITPKVKK